MKRKLTALLLLAALLLTLAPGALAAQGTKLAALTFDDGPGPYTERLLDGLAERGVKATFFCLGSRAEAYPATIRRMVEEGHQVANHSYDHPNLNQLSVDSALRQFADTEDILRDAAGIGGPYYCRAPYGNSTEALRGRMDAPLIYWSVDTRDWESRNAAKVQASIQANIFDGAILLLHDIHPTSVDGVLAALDALADEGYEFVTVKELFRRRGVTPENGVQYYSCKPTGTDLGALTAPEISVSAADGSVEVAIQGPADVPIYYTLDGSPVTADSACYTGPFPVELPCAIRAQAVWDFNGGRSGETVMTYTLPPAGEPALEVLDGALVFTPSAVGETVYYTAADGMERTADGPVVLEPDSWFTYYAGGPGLSPTATRRLLLSSRGNLFSDLDPAAWYYDAMDQAASKGYFQGTGAYAMNPQGIVTRGMLATLLCRFAGGEAAGPAAFSDVDPSAYYAGGVAWCSEQGFMTGVGGGRFEPGRAVTRQELAKILAAYAAASGQTAAQTQIASYKDAALIAPWAADSAAAVTALGLMQGSGGRFMPLGAATRAEIAAILLRLEALTA